MGKEHSSEFVRLLIETAKGRVRRLAKRNLNIYKHHKDIFGFRNIIITIIFFYRAFFSHHNLVNQIHICSSKISFQINAFFLSRNNCKNNTYFVK